MALAVAQYTTDQSGTVVAPGVAGKRLRLRRLLVSSEAAGTLRLLSDPAGSAAALLPVITLIVGAVVGPVFDEDGPAGGAGEALGVTSAIGGSKVHGVMLWTEAVD